MPRARSSRASLHAMLSASSSHRSPSTRTRPLGLARALLALSLSACSGRRAAGPALGGFERSVLRYEGSTNNVSMPELAEDLGLLAPLKLEYIGNNATGGPHSIQSVVTGDIDFGGSFNGAIINLVAAKAPLRAHPRDEVVARFERIIQACKRGER